MGKSEERERIRMEQAERKEGATKRARQAAQTKEALLKAAFFLFAKHGYDAVTVEDITKRAGVSKGSFYSHFAAKESVLTEHFRQVDAICAEAYGKMSKKLSAGKKLQRIVETMCGFCEECGVEFMRVIYANRLLHNEREQLSGSAPGSRIIPILCEIAQEGQEREEFPTFLDKEIFAREVLHLAHGIVYDWCMENAAFDLKKESRRVFGQLAEMAGVYRNAE